ncbi:MAG: hypothetical protein Q7J29_12090 [Stagnimonas sp.]|nr:hypothetical protein [Stagnimonas sp.]
MNHSKLHPIALLLLCAGLTACESAQLDVDLTVGGAIDIERLRGQVAAVELLDDTGSLHSLDLASDDTEDFTDYRDGSNLQLANAAKLPAGHYTGLRLRLAGSPSLRLEDGNEYTLTQSADGPFAALDLTLKDGDSAAVLARLDLRFSLSDLRASTSTFEFQPVLTAYEASDGASVEGGVSTSALDANGCRSNGSLVAGAAIYAFASGSASLGDYSRDRSPNPIASTRVTLDDDGEGYVYALPTLAEGSYRLALTCAADSDAPSSYNSLNFTNARSITLDTGDAETLAIGG